MFRLSCADYTFPKLRRLQALRLLRLLEFDAVGIGLFERSQTYRSSTLLEDPAGMTEAVIRDLSEAGLIASDVFLQLGVDPTISSINDPDPEVRLRNRTAFQISLGFCSDIGCRHMTGLPGVFHHSMTRERAVRTAASETAFRVEAADGKQIRYAIEPHIGSICATPRDTSDFLEQVGGLSLTLDYGHFIHAGFSDEEVHPLLAFTSHIHLRGARKGCLQAPVADSTIDFAGILERLRALHYDGYACCEYVWAEWQDCNRTDNVSETMALKELATRG